MLKQNCLLYVTDGRRDNVASLLTVKKLFSVSHGKMQVIAVIPDIPEKLSGYSDQLKSSVLAQLNTEVNQVFTDQLAQNLLNVDCEVMCTDKPATKIIKLATREQFSCVIKQAETKQGQHCGFEAIDMALLRKVPCPLLLIKPIADREKMKLAVAIDAENDSPISIDLSVKLLRAAKSLAAPLGLTIDIVSCWESTVEKAKDEPFIYVSPADIAQDRERVTAYQLKNLTRIIAVAKIAESSFRINQLNGDPDIIMPKFVKENHLSCLLLGTYSRKGLANLFLGNTAENILALLECSVLVVKPSSFSSPVAPY